MHTIASTRNKLNSIRNSARRQEAIYTEICSKFDPFHIKWVKGMPFKHICVYEAVPAIGHINFGILCSHNFHKHTTRFYHFPSLCCCSDADEEKGNCMNKVHLISFLFMLYIPAFSQLIFCIFFNCFLLLQANTS